MGGASTLLLKNLFGGTYLTTWPELIQGTKSYYAGIDFNGNPDRNAIAFQSEYVLT